MRVLGPNCLGFLRPGAGLNASLLTAQPAAGNIALISQSAAIGTAMLDWAVSAHVGFSFFASMGGMVDVGFADLIDFLGEDRYTRSILIYMENVGDARRFMSAARGFARSKPIIVLKPGRTAESARAALTHTGSWTGDDEVYDAAFKRAGALRVEEVADLFHAAEVLDSRRLPSGPGVAIVTNAGGLGLMARATLLDHGGRLAALSRPTMDLLDGALPPYWNHDNPVDVLGDATSERFALAASACLGDPDVNGLIVMCAPQGNARPDDMAARVIELVKAQRKPVIAVLMGGDNVAAAREMFKNADVPCHTTPEDAVRAYMNMYQYTRNLELLYETPAELPIDVAPPKQNLKAMLRRAERTGVAMLSEEESKRFISTYGFPVAEQRTVGSVEEALVAADELGYPTALKVIAHQITHKSEVGGVELGVCSPADLKTAYERLLSNVKAGSPSATIEGVSVERMVRKVDYELILGMKKDGQFGSVIVFGAGGVAAEGLGDFAVGLPPLNQTLARRMMEETRIYRRILDESDEAASLTGQLEELLTVLSNIVVDFPEIAQITINPVVISEGQACAVDARIILDTDALRGDSRARSPGDHALPHPLHQPMAAHRWNRSDAPADPARGRAAHSRAARNGLGRDLARPFSEQHRQHHSRHAGAADQHRLRPGDSDRRRAESRRRAAHHRSESAHQRGGWWQGRVRGDGARRVPGPRPGLEADGHHHRHSAGEEVHRGYRLHQRLESPHAARGVVAGLRHRRDQRFGDHRAADAGVAPRPTAPVPAYDCESSTSGPPGGESAWAATYSPYQAMAARARTAATGE